MLVAEGNDLDALVCELLLVILLDLVGLRQRVVGDLGRELLEQCLMIGGQAGESLGVHQEVVGLEIVVIGTYILMTSLNAE